MPDYREPVARLRLGNAERPFKARHVGKVSKAARLAQLAEEILEAAAIFGQVAAMRRVVAPSRFQQMLRDSIDWKA